MKRAGPVKFIRRNVTLPESFADRLDDLRERGGYASESELLRQAVILLDTLTDPKKEIILKEKGREQRILVPTAKK